MQARITEQESTRLWPGGELFVRLITADDPQVAVVIAHGAAEHSSYWRAIATDLADGLHASVLIPDLPGHGRSSGERLQVDEAMLVGAIDVVVDLHRAERPGLPIVLLGHSMGGLAAVRYAQRHGTRLAAVVLHAAGLRTSGGWDAEPKSMMLEEMTPDPDLQRIILDDEFRSTAPMPGSTRSALGGAAERALSAPPLGRLPLIWLQGQDDALVPEAGARTAFIALRADRGLYLSYPGIGHGGILERAGAQLRVDLRNGLRLVLRTEDEESR